jgi:hypothetical protein
MRKSSSVRLLSEALKFNSSIKLICFGENNKAKNPQSARYLFEALIVNSGLQEIN